MNRAVLAAIACAGCGRATGGELELVDVTRADLVVAVDVAGDLAAVDSTDIKPPTIPETSSFKIAWLAPEGSAVIAGAPVATFDSSDLARNLESLRSQADEWKARIDQAREQAALAFRADELGRLEQDAAVQRASRLAGAPADLVARLTLRSHQLDEQQARAELELATRKIGNDRRTRGAEIESLVGAQATVARQIAQLEDSLARLAVRAPRPGTVVYATSYAGDKRKAGDLVYSSDIVVQVVALDAMVGHGHVDEVDIARIAVREPVALRVDAFPDARLRGAIASIADSVQTSDTDPSNVVRLQIALEPAPAYALRPGMRFRGQIEIQRLAAVVQMPADAVFIAPDGPVAYRETAGGVERVRLELGRRSTDAIEVASGLSPGDRVSRINPEQAR